MKDIIQMVSILLILMNRLHLRLEGNIITGLMSNRHSLY